MVNLPQITGSDWLNSPPLTTKDLLGKVVLVDFWTYSCVNCLRTLPYLRDWWKKYKDKGLLIVGIHTPEFPFERELANVKQAVKNLEVSWPVLLDNEQKNWDAFANKYWPAKYLADHQGHIVYSHFGEGAYDETEAEIVSLLNEQAEVLPQVHAHNENCFAATTETYCGYYRGKLSGQEMIDDQIHIYSAPPVIPLNRFALQGPFTVSADFSESAGKDSVAGMTFTATQVNAVLEPVGAEAVVKVKFNNRLLETDIAGQDVTESTVHITSSRLYNLIQANSRQMGTITLQPLQGDFRLYSWTFSGCVPPEMPALSR